MDNPYQTPESSPPPLPVGRLRNPRAFALISLGTYLISLVAEIIDHLQRTFAAGIPLPSDNLHDSYYIVADVWEPLDWVMLVASLPSLVFYFLWKYRTAWNAWVLDPSVMKISPAMAVGSYFIPIVQFFVPCQAMAGIARASCGTTHGVAVWWATQVIAMLSGLGIGFMLSGQGMVARPTLIEHIYIVWSVITFYFAWDLLMRITRAQTAKCVEQENGL